MTPTQLRDFAITTARAQAAEVQEDLAALLAEGAQEIDNLDGPNNVVAQRLWAYMRRVDQGEVVVRRAQG